MKTIIALGILFIGFTSFGQNVTAEHSKDNNILYRGFENEVRLNPFENNSQTFQIETINCKVTKENSESNTYSVKTDNSKSTAQINNLVDGKVIESKFFRVQNLPSPTLYWGNNETGTTSSNTAELFVSYAPGIQLDANFKILSWECQLANSQYNGVGNVLSQEMMDATKKLASGELIVILMTVKSEDGILRKVVGSWVKQ